MNANKLVTKEFIYQNYMVEKLPLDEIGKKVGLTRGAICQYVNKFGFPKRNKTKTDRKIGETIGDWTLISKTIRKNKKGYWKCQCKCGRINEIETASLNKNKSKSCWECAVAKRRDTRTVPVYHWLKIQRRINRKRPQDLNHPKFMTHEYTEKLFEKQKRVCALSGLPIEFARGRTAQGLKKTTASLDRISSQIGYIRGNLQWVHKDINRLKDVFEVERFIELCDLVSNYNRNKLS